MLPRIQIVIHIWGLSVRLHSARVIIHLRGVVLMIILINPGLLLTLVTSRPLVSHRLLLPAPINIPELLLTNWLLTLKILLVNSMILVSHGLLLPAP